MMKKPLFCAAAALVTVLASCNPTIGEYNGVNVHNAQNPLLTPSLYSETGGVNPLLIQGKDQPGYVNPYPTGTYEHFVAQPEYPKTIKNFCNPALLSQATRFNSKIIICLPQQRARMYVEGNVAYDWPVSTGTDGHETPTGTFLILQKEKDHKSNRYGKFVKNGKTIDSNADTAKGIPEGATFRPAGMPNWNRLTWDGVGIHGGKVIPGRRLSHGCIRTPYDVAANLYKYTEMNMPVYISAGVEDYNRGGAVRKDDVKYRPGGDNTDMPQVPITG
ncbi:MAG: hypothetical protein E7030_00680 [Akkermansiaceae bacterium]|nr:hypothetical protein [Akkermansiaceae bacterium]